MATFVGTGIIWLASYVLTIAGVLFNWVMTNTVLQFGNVVTSSVVNAINIAWSAFRDISNIVIIGMFTFIAIATILGNTTYGYKKLLSRVLIVAILINFSLLFTKLVIDVSNDVAVQFLNAAANSNCAQCNTLDQTSGSSAAAVTTQASGASGGIAGAFLYYAGAQSFGKTYGAISSIAQNPQNGGWYALIYGIIIGVLEIIAAIVLLYGTILLIARAILMIFLMVTSAVAFATYLIPSLSAGGYGFSAWLQALLKNAVFAPLLAVLLWVTLTIAQAYNGTTGGSLGALVSDPTQPINVGALFGYILVIGLLFASIRIASSFATQVGGLNYGNILSQRALSNVTAAASGTGRFLRRQTLERFAYNREQTNATEAKRHMAEAAQARLQNRTVDADRLEKLAEQKARNSVRYGSFAGGYKKTVQGQAAKVAAVVQKAQVPAEERARQAKEAQDLSRMAKDNATALQKNLKETQDSSEASAKTVREEIEKEVTSNPGLKAEYDKNMGQTQKENQDAIKKIGDQYAEKIKGINDAMARGGISDGEKQRLQKQLLETGESRKSEMRHEDERLKKAQRVALLTTSKSAAAQDILARNDALRGATEKLEGSDAVENDLQGKIGEANTVAAKQPSRQQMNAAHQASADSVVEKASTRQAGVFGTLLGRNDELTKATRTKLKTDSENHRIKHVLNEQLKERGDAPGGNATGGDHH